jgi:putative aldouronate transport system permease protein
MEPKIKISKNDHVSGGINIREFIRKTKRDRYLVVMILPCVIYMAVFCYIPMYGVTLAFKERNIANPYGGQWVGLKYFKFFFLYSDAWRLIWNTLIINIYGLMLFPTTIILALLFNEIFRKKFKKFIQTISYVPYFISTVVVVGIMMQAISPINGWINRLIVNLGGEPKYFLIMPQWFRTLYLVSGQWQGIGWGTIIYMAAIASIDQELYDAAIIDGAGRFKQAIYVTIPSMANTIIILLIIRFGGMLSSGTEKILLMQNDLNMSTSDVLGTYLYRIGLLDSNFNLGTAVGFMNSVVSLILILIVNWIARRHSETSLF